MIGGNYIPYPDHTLLFVVAFLTILFIFLGISAKYKSFRLYTLSLIPIGFTEFIFLMFAGGVKSGGVPELGFYISEIGELSTVIISLSSIISGITIYPLSRRLHEKK